MLFFYGRFVCPQSFTPTTLSVTVAVSPSSACPASTSTTGAADGGGLSTAAIIGIAVGAGVLAIAVVAAVVGVLLYRRRNAHALRSVTQKLGSASAL